MTRPTRRAAATAAASALALAAVLGACGDDDDATASDTTRSEVSETTADAAGEELEVTGAWARTSPALATAGAVYLVVENPTGSDDALVGAAVDPSIAATVELHQTTADEPDDPMPGDGPMPGGPDEPMPGDGPMPGGPGMMRMTPVDEIPVPAGGAAVLEPGGYHIMLLDLAAPLEVGSTIEVTLTFAGAGEVQVAADVRDTAP